MRIALTFMFITLAAVCSAGAQKTATTDTAGQSADAKEKAESSPEVAEAASLNAQVVRLSGEGKYQEALPIAQRVLELREKNLGGQHPLVANALLNLATINSELRNLEEAKKSGRRALSVYEKLGEEYVPQQIRALDLLARLEPYPSKAIELHERNLALKEKTYGPDSPQVSTSLFPLAHLNELIGNFDKAEKLFARFAEIREKTKVGAEDDAAVAEMRIGCLLRKTGKADEAREHEMKAEEIWKSARDKAGPIQGGVVNGKAISKPQPSYPPEAIAARAQGTVAVQVLVGETGGVLYACASGDAHPSLKSAAEFAAYNARFTPTLLNGKPVKVSGVITYNFVLR